MSMDETSLQFLFGRNWDNVTEAYHHGSDITNTTTAMEEPLLEILVPLTLLYGFIFIAGVIGNVSTCIVISRNRSMHTATNFYLFSLAVSDLILLVCALPIDAHGNWHPDSYPLGQEACIALGLAAETAANATVLTITAFTVERYIAICRPFMSHTMSNLSRVVRFIGVIWLIAVGTAVPQAMQFGLLVQSDGVHNSTTCTIVHEGVSHAFVISSFIFFVGPMTVIVVLYALIGLKLRTSTVLYPVKKPSIDSNSRNNGNARSYRNGASQRRVIRMLVAVVVFFFICWAPFHTQRLLAMYGKSVDHPSPLFLKVYKVLTYTSGVLYFLSTAINPFLYSIMSNKFRHAFKVTLASWCSSKERRRQLSRMPTGYYSALSRPGPRASRASTAATATGTRATRVHSAAGTANGTGTRSAAAPGAPAACTPAVISHPHNIKNGLRSVRPEPGGADGGGGTGGAWGVARRVRAALAHAHAQPACSDSAESARSISNSSLRELDDEHTGEELALYMHQINRNIGAGTGAGAGTPSP